MANAKTPKNTKPAPCKEDGATLYLELPRNAGAGYITGRLKIIASLLHNSRPGIYARTNLAKALQARLRKTGVITLVIAHEGQETVKKKFITVVGSQNTHRGVLAPKALSRTEAAWRSHSAAHGALLDLIEQGEFNQIVEQAEKDGTIAVPIKYPGLYQTRLGRHVFPGYKTRHRRLASKLRSFDYEVEVDEAPTPVLDVPEVVIPTEAEESAEVVDRET
jgi:hypothetical protein